jgi:hypothetical protein
VRQQYWSNANVRPLTQTLKKSESDLCWNAWKCRLIRSGSGSGSGSGAGELSVVCRQDFVGSVNLPDGTDADPPTGVGDRRACSKRTVQAWSVVLWSQVLAVFARLHCFCKSHSFHFLVSPQPHHLYTRPTLQHSSCVSIISPTYSCELQNRCDFVEDPPVAALKRRCWRLVH